MVTRNKNVANLLQNAVWLPKYKRSLSVRELASESLLCGQIAAARQTDDEDGHETV